MQLNYLPPKLLSHGFPPDRCYLSANPGTCTVIRGSQTIVGGLLISSQPPRTGPGAGQGGRGCLVSGAGCLDAGVLGGGGSPPGHRPQGTLQLWGLLLSSPQLPRGRRGGGGTLGGVFILSLVTLPVVRRDRSSPSRSAGQGGPGQLYPQPLFHVLVWKAGVRFLCMHTCGLLEGQQAPRYTTQEGCPLAGRGWGGLSTCMTDRSPAWAGAGGKARDGFRWLLSCLRNRTREKKKKKPYEDCCGLRFPTFIPNN